MHFNNEERAGFGYFTIAPSKVTQDSLGFFIPPSGFRILGTIFQITQ